MTEEVVGIVLREKAYGDTSKIIDLLTREYGIIGVIVKGCKSMKSSLRSVTGKLCYGHFNIYYKENKLSLLKDVALISSFRNIQKDIEKISYATYLLDLAEQVAKQSKSNLLFDILIDGLTKIDDQYDPMVILNIIELKYLSFLGVLPILDSCAVCGSKEGIVTLSSDKGGYICSNCRTCEPLISTKAIKLIRLYYYVDIGKIEKLNVSNNVKLEINNFLNSYYDRYTGIYLKTKSFLNNIIHL